MSATGMAVSSIPSQSKAVGERYHDAYLVSRAVDGTGSAIKTVGFVLGGLIAIVGLLVLMNGSSTEGFGLIFLAIVAGIPLVVSGILVSAQAQLLKATLDTAVNTSPFLSNEQRAVVMSLPAAGAATESLMPLAPPRPPHVGRQCPKCNSTKTVSGEETAEHIDWSCNDCGHHWQQHLPTAAEARGAAVIPRREQMP